MVITIIIFEPLLSLFAWSRWCIVYIFVFLNSSHCRFFNVKGSMTEKNGLIIVARLSLNFIFNWDQLALFAADPVCQKHQPIGIGYSVL